MHNSKEDRQQREKNDKLTTNFHRLLQLIMVAPMLQNKTWTKLYKDCLDIDWILLAEFK